mgnify:CR=1 FL=1
MFKNLVKFFKSDNAKWVFVVIVVLLIIWALMSYSKSKTHVKDSMTTANVKPASSDVDAEMAGATGAPLQPASLNEKAGTSVKEVAQPKDLLPKSDQTTLSALNPMANDAQVLPDMLSAGSMMGTQSSTLRNANLQVRSDPAIARQDVGPLATLDYSHNTLINQPFKSTEFRISSAEFSDFIGKLTLTPDFDNWVDTTTKPDLIINHEGNYDNWVALTDAWGTQWNDWNNIVAGSVTTEEYLLEIMSWMMSEIIIEDEKI